MPAIVFQVKCHTEPGEDVRLVGSDPLLGNWTPAKGIQLQTSSDRYPQWKSDSIIIPPHDAIEYKYIVVRPDSGETRWEECGNRRIPPTSPARQGQDIMTIEDFFGDDRVQNICIRTVAPNVNLKKKQMPQRMKTNETDVAAETNVEPQMKPLTQIGSSIFFDTVDDEDEPVSPTGPSDTGCAASDITRTPSSSSVAPSTHSTIASVEWQNKRTHAGADIESNLTVSESQASDTGTHSEDLMLTWPHAPGTMSAHVLGSFTNPPWQKNN